MFVLQSIPSYVMKIFRLPNSLLDEIEMMMNTFWWGHGGANNRGIHQLEWDKLSMHKRHGGMGFKELAAFNLAMIGKQGWRFQTEPATLVSKVFKAKYFPHGNYLGSQFCLAEYFQSEIGHEAWSVMEGRIRLRHFYFRGTLAQCWHQLPSSESGAPDGFARLFCWPFDSSRS